MLEKREWFVLSYLAFFSATFLIGVSLPLVPTVLQIPFENNAYTSAVNTTYNTFSMTQMIPITGMLIAAIAVMFAFGGFAMTRGME